METKSDLLKNKNEETLELEPKDERPEENEVPEESEETGENENSEESGENEEGEENEENDDKEDAKSLKGIDILYLSIAAICAVITILSSIIIVRGWLYPERPPSVFGITPAVMSERYMESDAEDAIFYGDIIFLQKTDMQDLEKGEIVAFCDNSLLYIGRIHAISKTDDSVTATMSADGLSIIYPQKLTEDNFVGTVGLQIGVLGKFALFVITPLGAFLFCWIPAALCIAIILYEWLKFRKEAKLAEQEEEAISPDEDGEETEENLAEENGEETEEPLTDENGEETEEIHNGESEKADSLSDELKEPIKI